MLTANAVKLVLATLFAAALILGLTSRSLYGQSKIVSASLGGAITENTGQR